MQKYIHALQPALLGGGTGRFPRKRLVVFGFGGSFEHSDGEQDANEGETPKNHDQRHTAAGLAAVPSSTAPSVQLVRSGILISKSGELGRHFHPQVGTKRPFAWGYKSDAHNSHVRRQLSLGSERRRSPPRFPFLLSVQLARARIQESNTRKQPGVRIQGFFYYWNSSRTKNEDDTDNKVTSTVEHL